MYPCTCCSDDCQTSYPDCPSGNCLKAASVVVQGESSVAGCGASKTFDIGTLSDLSVCETTITWSLISWDTTAFTSVSINSSGVVSLTTTNAAAAGTAYQVVGKVFCNSTLFSQYFTLTIIVRNLCYGVVCSGATPYCNTCTGGCLADLPDVELL